MGVVVHLTARAEGLQVGGKLFGTQAGDEGQKVESMGADVADGPAAARTGGIGAPGGLFLAGSVRSFLGQPSCAYSACTTRIVPSLPSATIWRPDGSGDSPCSYG